MCTLALLLHSGMFVKRRSRCQGQLPARVCCGDGVLSFLALFLQEPFSVSAAVQLSI